MNVKMEDAVVDAHGIMDGATYVFRHMYSSLQNQWTCYDHECCRTTTYPGILILELSRSWVVSALCADIRLCAS